MFDMLKVKCILLVFLKFVTQDTRQVFCQQTSPEIPKCDDTSNIGGYWLSVQHGPPSSSNGSVLVNASVIGMHRESDDCSWAVEFERKMFVYHCTDIMKSSIRPLSFSNSGLKKVTVTATFSFSILDKDHVIRNCSFVDVTDCSRQLQLQVSSSKGSFNVSRNQNELELDSPGQVNFTVIIYNTTDPFHICHPLHYNWSFGDGQQNSTREDHISHFYKTSGKLFHMVVDVIERRKLRENISLIISIKGKSPQDSTNSTAIDVSLVLSIFFVALVVVICLVIILKKKVHRFTEVASFDFRHEDFQSDNGAINCEPRFVRSFMCRRGSEDQLLIPVHSSRKKFGSTLPNEQF